jgi:adenylate kinase
VETTNPEIPMMNLALLGPSGVGKGTHATSLAARFNLRHAATGDLFRHNLQTHTALGILARKYMAQGELVPDEVVAAMIEEWGGTLSPAQGTLFDGFPRTADQVKVLDDLLRQLHRTLDAVIYLKVPDDEIVRRLTGRLICQKCQAPYHRTLKPARHAGLCDLCGGELYQRPDDTAAMVEARLRIFHRITEPLLGHYRDAGKLVIVSGEGDIAGVEDRLVAALESVRAGTYEFATHEETSAISAAARAGRRPAQPVRPSLDLVLLGGPGSGKGTQAEQLCKELGLPHIATGDLFRENLRQQTDLGRLAKTYMDRGELVPDDITDAMVAERLARPDTAAGFVLDGYPRTLHQAEALGEMLSHLHRSLTGVLYINVPDAAIVSRLSGRLICRACQSPYHLQFKPPARAGLCDQCGGELYQRSDDNPATVGARLVTFHAQTEPLIAHFQRAGLLHEINGEGAVAEIFARSLATVRRLTPQPATV